MNKPKVNVKRMITNAIVGIYREGQSSYVGVVKIGDTEHKWYGYSTIPKCIKDVCNSPKSESNYAEVLITINENGTYPKINGVFNYIKN